MLFEDMELNLYLVDDIITNYSYLIASTSHLEAAELASMMRKYSKKMPIDYDGIEEIQVAYLGIAGNNLDAGFVTGAFVEISNPPY